MSFMLKERSQVPTEEGLSGPPQLSGCYGEEHDPALQGTEPWLSTL
jgi:hypothetical protein